MSSNEARGGRERNAGIREKAPREKNEARGKTSLRAVEVDPTKKGEQAIKRRGKRKNKIAIGDKRGKEREKDEAQNEERRKEGGGRMRIQINMP